MRKAEAEDIRCSIDACIETTPRRESDNYARAKGWHIYRHYTPAHVVEGPRVVETALCPRHAGNEKRQTGPVVIEGEQTLF